MASPAGGEPMSARKIQDLRVIDLKAQLEQRGIERTGVKASLIDRLKKALEEEGHDSDEYVFEIDMKKSSKTDVKEKDKDEEELEEADEMAGFENGDKTLTEEPESVDNMETTPATAEPAMDLPPESLNLGDELVLDLKVENTEKAVESTTEGDADHKKDVEATSSMVSEEAATEGEAPSKQTDSEMIAEPPSPCSVPVVAPFTKEDLISMDTSAERQVDEDLSLIVHIDESQMDLDNDLLNTPAKSTGADAEKEDGNTTPTADNQGDGSASADDTTPTKAAEVSDETETTAADGTTADPAKEQKTTLSKDGDKAKSTGTTPDSKDAKASAKAVPASSRNLWISGLASSTRATDLKTLFTKYGKVAGAKVVTNAKSPGSRCYGFVTMTTADEASKCIQHLHRTELHGKMISVERAKNDPSAQAKIIPKPGASTTQKKVDGGRDRRDVDRRDDRRTSGGSRRLSGRLGDRDRDRRTSGPGRRRSPHRSPSHRSPGSTAASRDKDKDTKDSDTKESKEAADGDSKDNKDKDNKDKKEKDVLDFEKIKAERERERLKQRERQIREDERRRMRELERMRERQHDVERRQREEAVRLDREKQRLRLEQQRLERERLEAERERIALERERQRRERERLEKEREQERQQQLRLEQERRAMKRNYDSRGGGRDEYWNDPKRPNLDRNSRYEDNKSGPDGFERRVERYDRRDGRPLDAGTGRAPADRFEGRRDERHDSRKQSSGPPRPQGGPARQQSGPSPRQQTGPPRQQGGPPRPGGPPRENRDRDDRGRPATEERNRTDRFPERRDGPARDGPNRDGPNRDGPNRDGPTRDGPPRDGPPARQQPSRDHDRPRHDRDRSPHAPGHHTGSSVHHAPARTSPTHRQTDTRDEWKSERNTASNRDGRGRGGSAARPAAGGDRGGYTENRDAATWHGNRAGNPPAQAERAKPHYNAGPGLLGSAPGTMEHQWSSNDRSAATVAPVISNRPADRGWPAAPSQATDRVSVRAQPAAIVAQQPLLQTPPSSAAFLASAANIMMGVGLASNRAATQDTRYDAYKNLQGGNVRRY